MNTLSCSLSSSLVNLGLAEVHLRVISLKLLQNIHLLLLIRGRQPRLLLALVKHHLLHHTPRLAIEVGQLRGVGLNLGDIDLGGRGDDVCPPFHLVLLVEMNGQLLASRRGLKCPCRFVHADWMWEVALPRYKNLYDRASIMQPTSMMAAWQVAQH